ncbi:MULTISPECIES: very short patch repair endonuclease [unclassified Nocardioides]|uniref:very short patch repair endonuclease n=1 Tax=unclassified Nocardioides TaxID=2615069 RepID=UPI0009E8AF23|nr:MULTISPECIES: very short patch repair endonuclease [unclassified Nocardioides]
MDRSEPTEHVRSRMQAQLRAGTQPELALRRELYRRGLRYRLGTKVPGRPRRTIDIAFPRQRVAVFVDGCFWHQCPVHSVAVKNNGAWWRQKLAANVARDGTTNASLEASGWVVLRFWEHELATEAADVVESVLRGQ